MDKKIVVDEDRHVIVGATFISPQVGDLPHSATTALVGQVPLERTAISYRERSLDNLI